MGRQGKETLSGRRKGKRVERVGHKVVKKEEWREGDEGMRKKEKRKGRKMRCEEMRQGEAARRGNKRRREEQVENEARRGEERRRWKGRKEQR